MIVLSGGYYKTKMSTRESSSGKLGSFTHGKSTNLVAATKSVLSEQCSRLGSKHSIDLELIEDLRSFIKSKCTIEANYCQALSKLSIQHLNRKYPSFAAETDSDTK